MVIRLVLLAATVVLVGGFASLDAEAAKRSSQPRLIVLAKPAVATTADRIVVSGRVRGSLRRGPRGKGRRRGGKFRVDLQVGVRRAGKLRKRRGTRRVGAIRFARRGAVRVGGKKRFSIKYRVPRKAGSVFLRLRLLRGRRVVHRTKAWKLIVRAPAAVPVDADRGSKTMTAVLDPGAVSSAPQPGEAGELRLNGAVDLSPGDVIAIGIGPVTPYGFLGKVVSVDHDVSSTILWTVPATLPEAVPQGSWSGHTDPEQIDSENMGAVSAQSQGWGATVARISGRPGSSPESIVRVQRVLKCGFDKELTVDGTVRVDSWIETSASWGFGSGVAAKFVGHMSADGELRIAAEGGASCGTGTKTLFLVPLGAIVFSVGPVPVVLVPAVSATLSAGGGLSGSATTSATATADIHAGVDYYDGQAHPVGGITPKLTGGELPVLEGSGHVGATISPAINVLVYGVAGPRAAVNVGLSLDASTEGTPPWTLTAPVSVTAAMSIPALSISSSSFTIWEQSYLLASGPLGA